MPVLEPQWAQDDRNTQGANRTLHVREEHIFQSRLIAEGELISGQKT